MKKDKNQVTLILLALCVIIWTVNVIMDIAFTERANRFMKLALDSICLATWIVAFIAKLKAIRKDNENSDS